MIAESTIGRDTQVEDAILQMCAQTEVDTGKATSEHCLVIRIDLTVAIDITIVAVTDVCTRLILAEALRLCHGVQFGQLFLRTDNALIVPSIELTSLFTHLSDVSTCDISLLAKAK